MAFPPAQFAGYRLGGIPGLPPPPYPGMAPIPSVAAAPHQPPVPVMPQSMQQPGGFHPGQYVLVQVPQQPQSQPQAQIVVDSSTGRSYIVNMPQMPQGQPQSSPMVMGMPMQYPPMMQQNPQFGGQPQQSPMMFVMPSAGGPSGYPVLPTASTMYPKPMLPSNPTVTVAGNSLTRSPGGSQTESSVSGTQATLLVQQGQITGNPLSASQTSDSHSPGKRKEIGGSAGASATQQPIPVAPPEGMIAAPLPMLPFALGAPTGALGAPAFASVAGGSMSISTSTRPPSDPATWGYAVVDHMHPTLQRVPVAPSVVTKTVGVGLYNNDVASSSTRPCGSSVCMRFVSRDAPGSCPLGESCLNFHIERSYLETARRFVTPLCCSRHNDYFTQEVLKQGRALPNASFLLILDDHSEVEVDRSQLAFTVGLDHLQVRGEDLRIIQAKRNICRLHLEGKCKWTKDCGHTHICREFYQHLQEFHYPSLVFLLSTENSVEAIIKKMTQSDKLMKFILSDCAEPLIRNLVNNNKDAAVQALERLGVNIALAMENRTGPPPPNQSTTTSSPSKSPHLPPEDLEQSGDERELAYDADGDTEPATREKRVDEKQSGTDKEQEGANAKVDAERNANGAFFGVEASGGNDGDTKVQQSETRPCDEEDEEETNRRLEALMEALQADE